MIPSMHLLATTCTLNNSVTDGIALMVHPNIPAIVLPTQPHYIAITHAYKFIKIYKLTLIITTQCKLQYVPCHCGRCTTPQSCGS